MRIVECLHDRDGKFPSDVRNINYRERCVEYLNKYMKAEGLAQFGELTVDALSKLKDKSGLKGKNDSAL